MYTIEYQTIYEYGMNNAYTICICTLAIHIFSVSFNIENILSLTKTKRYTNNASQLNNKTC